MPKSTVTWTQLYKNRSSRKIDSQRLYFLENMTSWGPFLLLRISFLGRPIVIQFIPADDLVAHEQHDLNEGHHDELRERAASIPKITNCDSWLMNEFLSKKKNLFFGNHHNFAKNSLSGSQFSILGTQPYTVPGEELWCRWLRRRRWGRRVGGNSIGLNLSPKRSPKYTPKVDRIKSVYHRYLFKAMGRRNITSIKKGTKIRLRWVRVQHKH